MFKLVSMNRLKNDRALFRYCIERTILHLSKMAQSRFEYVKSFETEDNLLPNAWIVVRLDGKNFHKFSTKHNFGKPNDARALALMNHAAVGVMAEYKDIVLAFGESDEYSFLFRKNTELYKRRGSKLMSYVNSTFSAGYVFYWKRYFGDAELLYPPAFDSRVVLYPSEENVRDYFSWRQADTHINNLYNTTFWNLILNGGLDNYQAQERLSGTLSSDKNEILFSEFGINYNNEPQIFRKGTILLKKRLKRGQEDKPHHVVLPLHEDLIQDEFWRRHSEMLGLKPPAVYEWPSEEALPDLVSWQLDKRKRLKDGGANDEESGECK